MRRLFLFHFWALISIVATAELSGFAQAFVVGPLITSPVPSITTATVHTFSSSSTTKLHALSPLGFSNHQPLAITAANTNTLFFLLADSDGNSVVDILRSIAVGITAILFLLAGLTYVTAALIIPAAAKELEKECLELAPDLWREYQTKLEPGETMAQRPDLMQELGIKLQPLIDQKIAGMDAAATRPSSFVSRSQWMDDDVSSTSTSTSDGNILDAQIVDDDNDNDDDKSSPPK